MKTAAGTSTAIASSSTATKPTYRELARDIAERWPSGSGTIPHVIGWQIDNEYADVSFDPETRPQFQEWLKAAYGTLDTLNARWTTAYWSQTYDSWDQIPMTPSRQPRTAAGVGSVLSPRPGASYQKNQLDVIRAQCRSAPVHHHQYHGLVRRLRPLRCRAGSGSGGLGRLRRRRPSRPSETALPRPDARIQAEKLLGDGDPAGHRELGGRSTIAG